MKKILALVLALMMVLTAVSALAAGSPENPGGKTTGGGTTGYSTDTTEEETKEDEVEAATVADTDATKAIKEELQKAAESGDVLSVLPDDVKAEIGEEFTKVNEMVTIKIAEGLDATKGLSIKKAFQTPYAKGAIKVLVAVPGADGKVEWIAVNGNVNEDGEVVAVVDEAIYNKIAGKEIVMVPVSK